MNYINRIISKLCKIFQKNIYIYIYRNIYERYLNKNEIDLINIPLGPCRVVSNPEREGFVRPVQAAFSSTVSRRRRASACSDASASFEPCRQVVDVLETTGRQLSSWHINTPDSRVPFLFRQIYSFLEFLDTVVHFFLFLFIDIRQIIRYKIICI